MSLFQKINFTSHAGLPLTWKLECDALTEADWAAIAYIVSRNVRFTSAHGIPRGGLAFAKALNVYKEDRGPDDEFLLIVDDVLTTGKSMEEKKKWILEREPHCKNKIMGVVLFSRAPQCPSWIMPVFTLNGALTGVK
jgi:hypothetical protein